MHNPGLQRWLGVATVLFALLLAACNRDAVGADLLLVRGDIELASAEQEFVKGLQATEWHYVDGDAPADPDLPAVRVEPGTLARMVRALHR